MDVLDAAHRGDLGRVRTVLQEDPGMVSGVDRTGRTPLLWAAYGAHVEVVRYILDHGAAVNYRNDRGLTALHWVCWGGSSSSTRVALLLLERGADVTAADKNGMTPLIGAVEGDDAIVRVLLEDGGSDLDAADLQGYSACHMACSGGFQEALRLLLEAGADPTLRDAEAAQRAKWSAALIRRNASQSYRNGIVPTRF